MAGVRGPCPKCGANIQAPNGYTAYNANPPQYPPIKAAETDVARSPGLSPQVRSASGQARHPDQETPIIRPEPRQLPNRLEPVVAPIIRHESKKTGVQNTGKPAPPVRRHRRHGLWRTVLPILFVSLAATVVYGVRIILEKNHYKRDSTKPGVTANEKVRIILPEEPNKPQDPPNQALVVENPVMPDLPDQQGLENPVLNVAMNDHGTAAIQLLETFLEMKSIEERMLHIETSMSKEALAASVLNGKLPQVTGITVDVIERNALERVTDFFYHVDFSDESGKISPQTMLVRKRGTQDPKVVVDPFIDLFGGRFARFASKPTPVGEYFQVIINAGAFCYDDVPRAEKKYTLKILSREDADEIASVYFNKESKIGQMLADENSGMAYGQAKPCVIYLRWNTKEDPEKPYIEALDIKALGWNP